MFQLVVRFGLPPHAGSKHLTMVTAEPHDKVKHIERFVLGPLSGTPRASLLLCIPKDRVNCCFAALRLRATLLGEVTVRRKVHEGRRGEVPKSESGFHLSLQLILPPLSTGSE
jgi:hypothetical protein